jgi:hypothetical protein
MSRRLQSGNDAEVIRFIIACIVRRDRFALGNSDEIEEIDKGELFWQAVDDFPFTFIDPPHDFFLSWERYYSEATNVVGFEGPLWSIEQGTTFDVYLLVEKNLGKTRKQFRLRDIRAN